MEKYEKYNPDEETIEAWLKGFEIRLLCNNITAADRKRNWCRALVGDAGNSVIEKLPQAATWAEIKAELCSVLGDGEPKKRAFKILSRYKPKSKGLGKWPLISWPKLQSPPMMPICRRSWGSRPFCKLCLEALAASCVEAFRIGKGSLGRGSLPPVCGGG